MAVAAAVVGDDGVGAVLAAPDVAAERHRAAGLIALITFSWSPTTWALQQVGCYPEYTARDAKPVTTAAVTDTVEKRF